MLRLLTVSTHLLNTVSCLMSTLESTLLLSLMSNKPPAETRFQTLIIRRSFVVVSAGIEENFSSLYAFSSIHSTIGNHLHVHCKQCSCNYSQFSNEISLLNDFGANLIWGQFKVWGEFFIPTIKTSFKAIKLQSEIKFSQSLPILTIPGRPSARVRRNKMRSRVLNVLLIMVSDNYFWNMKTDGEWDE